ncbi:MAG: DUF4188 domain-containing protein [Phormidesmis sp. RL_2_1]|nr:DUF4188 domain-containing protein [Phormidesmis sp. RL_2_1]
MNNIFNGRYTANVSEPFVVFLIGMRVNRFWAMKKWFAVAQAMGPMMQTLSEHPEKGLLGARMFFRGWPLETCLVSYWRSFDDLIRFARSDGDPHWPAWQQFMRDVGADGSVGIWHETYRVNPDQFECIYGNMPSFGLAAATTHVPVSEKMRTAQARMNVSA